MNFIPSIGVGLGIAENPSDVAVTIQLLIILTVPSLAPAILIMMTSFTRSDRFIFCSKCTGY